MLALSLLLAGGSSSTRIELASTPSFALADSEHTALGRAARADVAWPAGQSGFRLVASGREALATRSVLADLAERTLDLN